MFPFSEDTRTVKQIELSIKITNILSEINLKRLKQKSELDLKNKIDKDYFHFICICGIPPFQKQFEMLNLPGSKSVIRLHGFQSRSQEQYIQSFQQVSFQKQSEILRKCVLQHSNKKIIFVYHSFGACQALAYFQIFRNDHQISGIIDLAGIPLRCDPKGMQIFNNPILMSSQRILQNIQSLYESYLLKVGNYRGPNMLQNKYQMAIYYKTLASDWFKKIFRLSRQLPDVLKLFVYGTADTQFYEEFLAEKTIFYTQINRLPKSIQQKYLKIFNSTFESNVTNIQQRFCLSLQNGKHSIHMQKKHVPQIREIIDQYVYVLQEFCKNEAQK